MRLTQLTRSHEWWDHKTPQVLSLAYATGIMGSVSLYHLLSPAFLSIFASLVAIAVYASIINDFTDLEIDRACGKSNMMERLHPSLRLSLVLLSLITVLTVAFFTYPDIYAVVFYLSIVLAISLYSFSPVRLKKRGILGVISCASAEHLFPVLFSIAVIAYFSNFKADLLWLLASGVLAFLYGMRSILWHQFLDRDNDLQSGISTYGTEVHPDLFGKRSVMIICAELFALSIVLYLLNIMLPVIFLGLYLLFIFLRKKIFKSSIIIVVSPKEGHFQILMLDYYVIFFPLSLLIYAAFNQHNGWIVLLIHIALFHKVLKVTLQDIYYIIKALYIKFSL